MVYYYGDSFSSLPQKVMIFGKRRLLLKVLVEHYKNSIVYDLVSCVAAIC